MFAVNKDDPLINPYLAVVLAVLAAAFSSIFTKLSTAPPLAIAFYRLLFTVLMIAPLSLKKEGLKELAGINARDLVMALLSGVFLAAHFAVWITSLNYTSISSSTVLVTMQPLFVIAGGMLFLGERIRKAGLFGAVLSLAGSVLIGINDFKVGGMALYGDFLAFSGAIFVAAYFLIGRNLRKKLSLFTYVFLVYGTSAAVLFWLNLLTGSALYPYPAADWIWFAALALVPTIFGHTVFNWALKYVKAAVVSVSILGEPVGATILAYFIFGQIPAVLQVAGGIIIITGLCIFIKSSFGDSR
ncbi:MAG: DMT family transporter [Bacillota bacterium]